MNYNPGLQTSGKMIIPSLDEEFEYFLQRFTIPQIDSPNIPVQYMNHHGNEPSNNVSNGTFNINFVVQEELDNYLQIDHWIAETRVGNLDPSDYFKDIKVMITNSNKNVVREFTFKGAFPIILGELTYDTKSPNAEIIPVDASFVFQSYSIK